MKRLAILCALLAGCATNTKGVMPNAARERMSVRELQGTATQTGELDARQHAVTGAAHPTNTPTPPANAVRVIRRVIHLDRINPDSIALQRIRDSLFAEPTPPTTTIRLRFTLPDSVEWRRPGYSHADSAKRAVSDMRAEVWWVARWPAPWPPVAYRESLLCVSGWRAHGSPIDTVISTPGHGTIFVRARNVAGVWPIKSNLAAARTTE